MMTRSSFSQPLSRRLFVVGGAMAVTAATAFAAKPRRVEHRLIKHNLADIVPRTIGPWSVTTLAGMVVATEDQAAPIDGYDQVLTRVYAADNLPTIMLLLAYGSTQGGTLQLHRPETCYPGQGFHLADFSDVDLNLGGNALVAARKFTAVRDERIERLTYWTRVSSQFPRTTAEEYASIITSVLRGTVPDGLLVRMSALGQDDAILDASMARFAATMISTSGQEGRELLVGDLMTAAISGTAAAHNK